MIKVIEERYVRVFQVIRHDRLILEIQVEVQTSFKNDAKYVGEI